MEFPIATLALLLGLLALSSILTHRQTRFAIRKADYTILYSTVLYYTKLYFINTLYTTYYILSGRPPTRPPACGTRTWETENYHVV